MNNVTKFNFYNIVHTILNHFKPGTLFCQTKPRLCSKNSAPVWLGMDHSPLRGYS